MQIKFMSGRIFQCATVAIIAVVLTGCSGQGKYSKELGLEQLAAPTVMIDKAEVAAKIPAVNRMYDLIRKAKTKEETEEIERMNALTSPASGAVILSMAGKTPLTQEQSQLATEQTQSSINHNRHAILIKRAQIAAGDLTDSTGEVEEHLGHALQSVANIMALLMQRSGKTLDELGKGNPLVPGGVSSAASAPGAPAAPVPTPTPAFPAELAVGDMPRIVGEGTTKIEANLSVADTAKMAEDYLAEANRVDQESKTLQAQGKANRAMALTNANMAYRNLNAAADSRSRELHNIGSVRKAREDREQYYREAQRYAEMADTYFKSPQ